MLTYATEISHRRGEKASFGDAGLPYQLENASPAGVFVCPGTADQSCKAPTSDAEVLNALGVVVYRVGDAAPADTMANDYASGTTVEVCDRGDIWVVCEEAMAVTDPVYVRKVAGAGEQLGAVRNDADTTDCTLLPNVRVAKASSGPGVVKLRINLPAAAS